MYSLNDIRHLHLEITTKCNAGCPMCPRHYSHTSIIRDDIGNTNMTLNMAKKILQTSLLTRLQIIDFCGNYGDAISNHDFIPIVKYIRSVNPNIFIRLVTNGGARDKKFWIDVAHLVDECDFGIDGLKDTNHLYRQFVNWNILERNVRTYTKESIKLKKRNHSYWIMNVFRHNMHQIQDAKKTAYEWGISRFVQRFTDRFGTTNITNWPVYDKNLNLSHIIQPSNGNNHDNTDIEMMQNSMQWLKTNADSNIRYELTKEIYETLSNRYGNDKISCKVLGNNSIYIDYMGKLYPCCYVGATMNVPGDPKGQQLAQMYDQFGKDFNNLNVNNIESIFDSGIFEEFEISWYKKNISCGKTAICIYKCGKNSQNYILES